MDDAIGRLLALGPRLAAGEVLRPSARDDYGHDTFVREHVGLVIDELAWTHVTGHLDAGPQHWQYAGIVHGGVWAAVVETLASWGAAIRAAAEGATVVGVSNTTNFLRPHREGRVEAVATPVDVHGLQQVWDVRLTRATDGKPVAIGTVRLQQLSPGG